jgi:hypothetical protein
MKHGDLFTLPGQLGVIFRAEFVYLAAGFIPSVQGRSVDGGFRTCARIEDVCAFGNRVGA